MLYERDEREIIMVCIGDAHRKALDVIRQDAYEYKPDEEIFEMMIEEYLLRENGRLGIIKDYIYIEKAKTNAK